MQSCNITYVRQKHYISPQSYHYLNFRALKIIKYLLNIVVECSATFDIIEFGVIFFQKGM